MRPATAVLALVALLVVPALPGATGGQVMAHAQLVASSPGAGEVLEEAPQELRLIFSEALEVQVTSLDVVTLGGVPVLTRAGEIDPEDPYALVVAQPELGDGVYSVTWRTLSAVDGHTAEGTFTFGIGEVERALPTGDGAMTHSETDAVGVFGRWLTYIGLLLAFGLPVFFRVVIREPMTRTAIRTITGGLALSAAATLFVAVVSAFDAGGLFEYLFGSRNGALQLARAAVAAAGAATLFIVANRFAGGVVAASSGLVGIILLVLAGHAAALPGPVPVIGQVVHVAGAAVWFGGLLGLLGLVMRPSCMTSDGAGLTLREGVPRFSALALVSIGLLGLTGIYAAWMQTGQLLATDTEYGGTLLLKTVFAVGALGLGGLNFLDGGRLMGWLDGFRPRLILEITTVGVVLLLTGALATTPPQEEAQGVAIEPIPDAFGNVTPEMELELLPGRPGVNRAVVTTTDALAAASSLELALDRLDTGTTTRYPLRLEDMAGMDHGNMAGMDHGSTEDGTVAWIGDAVVLPPGSQWDGSVRILSTAGDTEISRQRYAFTVSEAGVDEGRIRALLDPAIGVGVLLLLGGGLGIGLGLGGLTLPRTEAVASRVALLAGGGVAVVLGGLIGAARFLA